MLHPKKENTHTFLTVSWLKKGVKERVLPSTSQFAALEGNLQVGDRSQRISGETEGSDFLENYTKRKHLGQAEEAGRQIK